MMTVKVRSNMLYNGLNGYLRKNQISPPQRAKAIGSIQL